MGSPRARAQDQEAHRESRPGRRHATGLDSMSSGKQAGSEGRREGEVTKREGEEGRKEGEGGSCEGLRTQQATQPALHPQHESPSTNKSKPIEPIEHMGNLLTCSVSTPARGFKGMKI